MESHLPRNPDQLWRIMARKPRARLYAGGTDLLVELERTGRGPQDLICLERIAELRQVRDYPDRVFIGACARVGALLTNRLVRRHFPILVKALAQLGSLQIRNMATIGGNLVSASPAGDSLPPLYLLNAEVELWWFGGRQRMPVAAFVRGPGQTVLEQGQILAGVWINKQPVFTVNHFEKVGRRKALAIAVVSLAACIRTDSRGLVTDARLALGSVGPTVVRVSAAERCLVGRRLAIDSLDQAALLVRQAVDPIDDVRASAAYRRQVAGNLVLRLARYADGTVRPPGEDEP